MSFTGDLEHLPIVDVIQLMNSSRKSGILSVKGKKGESRLVFKDGFIVSASHLNNSIRIGRILVDMGLISRDQLEKGLSKQQLDGGGRRPLAITLIELGLVREEDAHKGLQKLIEITLVEILTWKTGKFTLEALSDSVSCDFRYYPEKMDHEVNLNTQSILMDALRIFDEKMRDGLIEEEDKDAPLDDPFSELLSEDLLGLSEIDHISARLPKSFSGLTPLDPVDDQRSRVGELAPHLPPGDLDKIAVYLATKTPPPRETGARTGQKEHLILLSRDRLLGHALATVCGSANMEITVVETVTEAESAMAAATGSDRRSCLVIDSDAPPADNENLTRRTDICAMLGDKFPHSIRIQLALPGETRLAQQAYMAGARAVMPRPPADGSCAMFADDLIALLEILPAYLQGC